MFENLQPIQIFNAVVNVLSVVVMFPVLFSIMSYKKRAKERFDQIEKELDHILLLSHELYQSDVKEKANPVLDQEITTVRPTAETPRTKTIS